MIINKTRPITIARSMPDLARYASSLSVVQCQDEMHANGIVSSSSSPAVGMHSRLIDAMSLASPIDRIINEQDHTESLNIGRSSFESQVSLDNSVCSEAARGIGLRRTSIQTATQWVEQFSEGEQLQIADHMQLGLLMGEARSAEKIAAGNTNVVYKMNFGAYDAIVRFPCNNADYHGVDRAFEQTALKAASWHGIGPHCYLTNSRGLLCMEYIAAEKTSRKDLLKTAPEIIKKLHSLEIGRKEHTQTKLYQGWVDAIAKLYTPESLPEGYQEVCDQVMDLLHSDEVQALPKTLCHMDLNADNFLRQGKRTVLIDFETTCYASPLFDLASFSKELQLTAEEEKNLVNSYQPEGFEPKAVDSGEFDRAFNTIKVIFKLRPLLWNLIQSKTGDKETNKCDYDFYSRQHIQGLQKALLDLKQTK